MQCIYFLKVYLCVSSWLVVHHSAKLLSNTDLHKSCLFNALMVREKCHLTKLTAAEFWLKVFTLTKKFYWTINTIIMSLFVLHETCSICWQLQLPNKCNEAKFNCHEMYKYTFEISILSSLFAFLRFWCWTLPSASHPDTQSHFSEQLAQGRFMASFFF